MSNSIVFVLIFCWDPQNGRRSPGFPGGRRRATNKQTLKNLKVTILYINHDYETRDGLSSSLVKLWEDLFNYIGVDNYEVIKQLDIQ